MWCRTLSDSNTTDNTIIVLIRVIGTSIRRADMVEPTLPRLSPALGLLWAFGKNHH